MTIIILIIIGIAIVVLLLTRKGREAAMSICAVVIGLDAKKQGNKEKILTFLAEKSELSNSDIRKALKVSERTAIRYMDELEKEGKVERVGSTGRSVTYRLKP